VRKALGSVILLISVLGLAVACQSGKSARGAGAHNEQTPSPVVKNQANESGSAESGTPAMTTIQTRTSSTTLKCIDNGSTQCDIMKIIEMQREGHVIFSQAWMAIFKTSNEAAPSPVASVFQATLWQLQKLYRADGSLVSGSSSCDHTRPLFENLSTKVQTRYVLSLADCQNSARRQELASFEKQSKNQWSVTYNVGAMPKSAVGEALQFLAKPVVCHESVNDSLKVTAMDCSGLGQRTPVAEASSSDAFTSFATFRFSAMDTANLLMISGSKNRSLQDSNATRFNMTVPVSGPILYNEKVVIEQKITEPATPVAAPAVTTSTQAVAASPAPAGSPAAAASTPDQKSIQERVELLSVLTQEDRRLFDTSTPEVQEQMLESLREEKAAAQAQQKAATGETAEADDQNANDQGISGAADPIVEQGGAAAVQAQDGSASVR
jgi:hypothetical protein